MKRKIIKLGTATLVTSLPRAWVVQFGIKAGDYLEVSQHNKDLVLSTERRVAVLEKTLDCRRMNTRLAEEYLVAAYMLGYHTIEILHEPRITEYRTHRSLKTTEWLQERLSQLMIGVEVIEQSETRTLIKELAVTSPEERANILRRIFLLTKDMGESLLAALEKNDREALLGMTAKHRNVRKFLNYFQRVLNKEGYGDFAKTNVAYVLADNLWFIPGTFRFIADDALKAKKRFSKQALELMRKTNDLLAKLTGLVFDYKPEKAMELLSEREQIWEGMVARRPTPEEASFYARLAFIGAHIMHCVRAKLELEL